MMAIDVAGRPDYESALEVVTARTEQLSRFMKGFAEVVRLPAPRKAPCDVRKMLEDSVTLFSRDAEARRIAWRWEAERDLPPVPLDRPQMEQVFVNVLKNSIEAVGEQGTITLRLGRKGHRVGVEIEDTGRGLSDDARSNLFTPFFTTKEGGQGVGLTLVQEVLTQHGCEYSLDGPAGGPTRFTILF